MVASQIEAALAKAFKEYGVQGDDEEWELLHKFLDLQLDRRTYKYDVLRIALQASVDACSRQISAGNIRYVLCRHFDSPGGHDMEARDFPMHDDFVDTVFGVVEKSRK